MGRLATIAAAFLLAVIPAFAQCTDCDGDGFESPVDCNDANSSTFPGAPELCDGYDNDCDGMLDNNLACNGSCDHPGKITPEVRVSDISGISLEPTLAWTGSEFAIAWADSRNANDEIFFVRLDASGQKLGSESRISDPDSFSPALSWTGTEYSIAWYGPVAGNAGIHLARLDADGMPIGTQIDFPGLSELPSITWAGLQYGLVWQEEIASGRKVFFALLDSSGTKIGADQEIAPANPGTPVVIWTGFEYGVAWVDGGLHFTRLDQFGSQIGSTVVVSTGDLFGQSPTVAWSGLNYGIAWGENRGTKFDVFFTTIDPAGGGPEPELRITDEPLFSGLPTLAWTGVEYGLAWMDARSGNFEIYFVRLDSSGSKLGTDHRITQSPATADSPKLVWNGTHYGVIWSDSRDNIAQTYFARIGCDCIDADGDGHSACIECDDTDPNIFPGSVEVCDGVDNNCNTLIDEELGQIVCGVGACLRVVDNCVGGQLQSCVPGSPTAEVCDGVDNDCNGLIDDIVEVCNGLDDDCDGLIDEDATGADTDGDGVANLCDNCRLVFNPSQADMDGDDVGNSCDNCLFEVNPDQADLDGDQRGDICDNCPTEFNSFQDDLDLDGVGDVCDNCALEPNSDQGDIDGDFEGDVCDFNDGLIYTTALTQTVLSWQQEMGFTSFNVYRGDVGVLVDGDGDGAADDYCADRIVEFLAVTAFADTTVPAVGAANFYVVTGNGLGGESGFGNASSGAARFNTDSTACLPP